MRRVLPLLLLGVAIACASPSGTKPKGDGAKAPVKKPAKTAKSDAERARQQPGEGREFTPSERAKMEVAWQAFKDESATWPALRDDWVAIGERARNTLVENLLRGMVLARLANQPRWAVRARNELIILGPAIIPTVEGVLQNPTIYDPTTKRSRNLATEIQTEINELLLVNGEAAVPALIRLTKCKVPTARRNAIDSLGRLKSPSGVPVIVRILGTSPEWIDRLYAARALGYGEDPRGTRALMKALDDADQAVVIESAHSLARQGAEVALPALSRRREKAQAVENYKIARACGDAAKIIRDGKSE